MKKCGLTVVLFSILFLSLSTKSALAETSTDAIADTLSEVYGAPVEVKIDNEKCLINYPETTIEQKEVEYKQSPTDKDEMIVETKNVTSTIPATSLSCERTDDFYGQPQYSIVNKSPNKLLAQLYNLSKLAFFKDVIIQNFSEETKIVPVLGLVSGEKIQLSDAIYVEKNPTTGLKSELGNLKKFTYEQKLERDNNVVKYRVDSDLQDFNLALPMFSVRIASERQAAAFDYKTEPNQAFDRANSLQNASLDWVNGLQNLDDILSFTSRAVGKGIQINADIFNAGIGFDIDVKNSLTPNKSGSLDMVSKVLMHHIVFHGDLIEKAKQANTLLIKYTLQNVDLSGLTDLSKLQQSENQNDNDDSSLSNEEMAKILDEILDKAKLRVDFKVKFAAASMTGHFDFYRQNNYLHGSGEVYIKNLFGIFPAQKQCINNPQADELSECQDPMYLSVKEWIDVSQNDPLNVYQYNEKGVFKNGEKIGEPIEIDFQKIMQEQDENEQPEDDETADDENIGDDDSDNDDDEDVESMMREIDEDTDTFINDVAAED